MKRGYTDLTLILSFHDKKLEHHMKHDGIFLYNIVICYII